MGSVISQKGKPIAFYGRKLNPTQVNYTTTERELLSIVDWKYTIWATNQRVYRPKKLFHKTFNTERVMKWRILLEEYNLELIYIQCWKNIAADALSR